MRKLFRDYFRFMWFEERFFNGTILGPFND